MPPRYSRNNHPWWMRLQLLQIWINEKQYLAGHRLRKIWWKLPFNRGRLKRSPASGPLLLANPLLLCAIIFVLIFLLVFGEGLLNTGQIVGMMTGVDTEKLDMAR